MLTTVGLAFTTLQSPHPTILVHEGGDKKARVIHIFDARSGHDAKTLRGEGADHILMDEAAFVPESLITEVAMPMLAANNGRMTLISTPRGRNFFYRLFAMGQREENGFWSRHSPSSENPNVSKDYLGLQKEILSERAFLTEYCAEFLDSNSAVFGIDFLDAALGLPTVEVGQVVLGIDWARCTDFTAAVAVRGTKEKCEVIHVEAWNHLRWSEQVHRVAQLAKHLNARTMISDITGLGDPVTENLKKAAPNIAIQAFTFTRQSKMHIIDRLNWMFEHGAMRLPSNMDLLRQLENFEGHADEHGVKYEAATGYHDDLVCALAMACAALPHGRNLGVSYKER